MTQAADYGQSFPVHLLGYHNKNFFVQISGTENSWWNLHDDRMTGMDIPCVHPRLFDGSESVLRNALLRAEMQLDSLRTCLARLTPDKEKWLLWKRRHDAILEILGEKPCFPISPWIPWSVFCHALLETRTGTENLPHWLAGFWMWSGRTTTFSGALYAEPLETLAGLNLSLLEYGEECFPGMRWMTSRFCTDAEIASSFIAEQF